MRLASVDIGTNTVRLLVADANGGSLRFVFQDRAVVRLGEGLSRTGRLKKEAMERAVLALERFKRSCDELGVEKVVPIATAAVREAENRDEFLKLVLERVGWRVRVISGEQEARFTYLGVKRGLGLSRFLVFDIGGGSTEYICASGSLSYTSLPMGVVKLTEQLVKGDPPSQAELEALRGAIRGFLDGLNLSSCFGVTVVGTAGTPTTLAALDMRMRTYDPERVHGYRLSYARLEEMFASLSRMRAAERLRLPGMERGREDLIIAGTLIVLETLKKFGADEMVVSEWGIREGVILAEVDEGEG